ncbi:MAG: valine--tRNA ligase [Candidatus Micrarchaeota archaeon]|nr:valine--tRNA ligase [Candidatus Micrarchaeota archaeon]
MALDKYSRAIEAKWRDKWLADGTYNFDEKDEKRELYSLDTPPPFTSGDFHMGHVLSYAYFDFVARYKRMRGFNVYYPQGWDCQGFPTEVKVEAKYGRNLPREEFRAKCVEWTGEYIKRMKGQMLSLGLSPDWRYEYRTMDQDYHRRVQYSLLKMYEQKLLYRAEHPVFWCPNCGSAIAKAETNEIERETVLSYLRFEVEGKELLIATTRPEYLHACVAVFVHPNDGRYNSLQGKEATTPLGKKVPIMADPDVDKEFGTGVVMVCTFGDKTDVVWAYRHNLPIIKAMDQHGRLINAGKYNGLKTAEARTKLLMDLDAEGKLARQEPLKQIIKVHDRCKKPVELLLSNQWFAKLKGFEEKIIDAGKSMKWVPEFTIQYFIDWARFVEWDWVISRQRVFGTPIPFWYCEKCGEILPAKYEELPANPPEMSEKKCKCGGKLTPETSTCDCCADSSITQLIISGWPDNSEFHARIYPISLRPQGTEIIRTWAFYTVYRCLMLTGKAPFRELLLNGNVLAPDGKKMSKSLNNVIAPDSLVEKYSGDAVRQWAALSGALAKDRPFIYKDVDFAQSFINKLWNASLFVETSTLDYDEGQPTELRAIDMWMLSRLAKTTKACTEAYENFDFHAAITAVYEFFWHEFCDHYLEAVKHRLYQPEKYGGAGKAAAQRVLRKVLLSSLKLLSPVVVFTTEEIYSHVFAEKGESIHLSAWPPADENEIDEEAEKAGTALNSILSGIRRFKAENKMPLNAEISRAIIAMPEDLLAHLPEMEEEIKAVGRAKEISASKGEISVRVEK